MLGLFILAPPRGAKEDNKEKRLFSPYPVYIFAEGKGTACVRGKPSGFSPKERCAVGAERPESGEPIPSRKRVFLRGEAVPLFGKIVPGILYCLT